MAEKSLRQSFSHLFQEETHLQDVETVGVIRHTPVLDIQIIHAGGKKNCVQCIHRLGKILFARVDVERYLAHGSVLHRVDVADFLRKEVEHGLIVINAGLAYTPIGISNALFLVFLGATDNLPQDRIAYLVAFQHIFHVTERYLAFFRHLFKIVQRSILSQSSFQFDETITMFRGRKSVRVNKSTNIAACEELDE